MERGYEAALVWHHNFIIYHDNQIFNFNSYLIILFWYFGIPGVLFQVFQICSLVVTFSMNISDWMDWYQQILKQQMQAALLVCPPQVFIILSFHRISRLKVKIL